MRKLFFTVAIPAILLLLVSCKSADKNADAIAADMCNCFKSLETNLSNDAKNVVKNAANAADPVKSLKDDVMALGEEKGQQVGVEMQSLGDMENESSETGRCIKDVEKKYKNAYTMNEEKTLQKIIKELEGNPGCSFTASLLKLGLKMKGKSGVE